MYFTLFSLVPLRNEPAAVVAFSLPFFMFDILLALIDDLNICLFDLLFSFTGWRLQQRRAHKSTFIILYSEKEKPAWSWLLDILESLNHCMMCGHFIGFWSCHHSSRVLPCILNKASRKRKISFHLDVGQGDV